MLKLHVEIFAVFGVGVDFFETLDPVNEKQRHLLHVEFLGSGFFLQYHW